VSEAEALRIFHSVNALNEWQTPEKTAMWVGLLSSPQQADVNFADAMVAVLQLLSEMDPKKIYPALVLEKARGIAMTHKPSTVEEWDSAAKLALEGPQDAVDPTATGPAARGAHWARRHGIKRNLTANPQRRAELAQILGNLGEKMNFHCIRCHVPFTRLDVDGYVLRCMDAGRNDAPEPPRWCMRCTPAAPKAGGDDECIPF
jgi:hypothetical protein